MPFQMVSAMTADAWSPGTDPSVQHACPPLAVSDRLRSSHSARRTSLRGHPLFSRWIMENIGAGN